MKYYVYKHVCPRTGETVYFGKGVYGRAWDVTRARSQNSGHCSWMKELSEDGYIPQDWVVILNKCLSETEAFALEKEYLHDYGPTKFNGQIGERNNKALLTNDQVRELYTRLQAGERVAALAKEFNTSRTNLYHIKNRKQWRAITSQL